MREDRGNREAPRTILRAPFREGEDSNLFRIKRITLGDSTMCQFQHHDVNESPRDTPFGRAVDVSIGGEHQYSRYVSLHSRRRGLLVHFLLSVVAALALASFAI